ncbi:MAG: GspH/FimT family protein [Trueperaceae bacterium]
MKRSGLTIVELLVLLAVLSVLLSVAWAAARPDNTHRAAQAVRAAILWARANAIWRGVSVAVTDLGTGAGFEVRAATTGAAPCSGGAQLLQMRVAEHPGVSVLAGLPRGLVWLPDGSGRSCDGGGVISATIRLRGARHAVNVVVSSLGRVRLETAP